ncbi:protein jagunal-like isoform X1 [Eriocheir sinensis]|uniref:protein jagunal-like isoform X1 n=1 Tax=Eriocheir sinensis TaxID=95602 RepID=UPI0021C81087|nr:protein jagunal-like isoform X1 [Eriocheir sinensis]
MASRDGPMVSGTDGSDFVHRETVAPHYQISWPTKKTLSQLALNKGRLRKCVFSHLLLALLMLIKMVPDILDRLDIFILEIEELEVPQPLKWEYIWLVGSLASFLGLTAIRKNRVMLLQIYFGLVNLLSTVPILLAAMIYFKEFAEYCTEDEPQGLQLWQGYPISVLWYSFILVAMQVHIFTLIFAWKLIYAWKNRGATKKVQ